jgi:hypothetical protein
MRWPRRDRPPDRRGVVKPGRGRDGAEIAALLPSHSEGPGDRRADFAVGAAQRRGARIAVADVDIGRGWVRVTGKGDKERRVPLDPDVSRPDALDLFSLLSFVHRRQDKAVLNS